MSESSPFIISACRTPIGRFLGGLSSLSAVEFGAIAARAAIARATLAPDDLDEAIVGNVLQAGLGQAPARQVALKAGMSEGSSALTVNMVCGSGLRAVMLAASAIKAGDASIVLAGGMESMSNAPHLLRGARSGWKFGDGTLVDSMLHDGLTCASNGWTMGLAAEHTARVCGLTRQDLDGVSLESQRRAIEAQGSGAFENEIVPVEIVVKGAKSIIKADEGPRADTSLESLARLKPAFDADGVVTPGNASTLSDGAAMVVVASPEVVKKRNLSPMARIVATSVSGLAPKDVFLAPVGAIRRVLEKAGLAIDDVDLFEINEAFASQLLGCEHELGLDHTKVNIHGGAIALGHPIGASGARVLVTLLHALERRQARFGLASLCLGGGNAVAMVVERFRPGGASW